MANGGNPEEAVDAYRRALELKPTFTRAIFNLGVACARPFLHLDYTLISIRSEHRRTPGGGGAFLGGAFTA